MSTLTALPSGTLTRCPIDPAAQVSVARVTALLPLTYYAHSVTGRWTAIGTRSLPGAARYHSALLDDALLAAAGCRVRDDGLVVLKVAS